MNTEKSFGIGLATGTTAAALCALAYMSLGCRKKSPTRKDIACQTLRLVNTYKCINNYNFQDNLARDSTVERGVARVKLRGPGLKGARENFAIAK